MKAELITFVQDISFDKSDYDQFQSVLAPKVTGTINLHNATKDIPLDFFVMASSITSLIGTPTQAAYVAGNSFQDTFARYRQSQNLPGTALNIGLILEIGAAMNSIGLQQSFKRGVTYGISETEFLDLIEVAFFKSKPAASQGGRVSELDAGCSAQIVTGLEPSKFIPFVQEDRMEDLLWYNDTRFRGVVQAIVDRAQAQQFSSTNATGGTASLIKKLQLASSVADKESIASTALVEHIAELLGTPVSDIDAGRPMADYGLDSLVTTELRSWLNKTFGSDVSPLQLLSRSTTIVSLVKVLVS